MIVLYVVLKGRLFDPVASQDSTSHGTGTDDQTPFLDSNSRSGRTCIYDGWEVNCQDHA